MVTNLELFLNQSIDNKNNNNKLLNLLVFFGITYAART